MGNRLRHAYDRLDLDIVWNTARDRLPALATYARRALTQLRGDFDEPEAVAVLAHVRTVDDLREVLGV